MAILEIEPLNGYIAWSRKSTPNLLDLEHH
jgi:hypothetical protein